MYTLTRSGLDPKKTLPNSCGKNWVLSIKAAVDEEGYDPNIFVYQVNLRNEPAGDMFVDVADVHDLNFLPLGSDLMLEEEHPTEDHVPYYRTDEVTLDCYTADEADAIWEKVKQRVRALVREKRASEKLKEKEEYHA